MEATAVIAAPPADLFARLDDQTRLAKHMTKPSLIMGGGRMRYEFDEGRGRTVGSHILMSGAAFGLKIFVDEVVTEREPPWRKRWRTVGVPKLIVMGGYEMGFEIGPTEGGSRLRVWLDYEPAPGPAGWLPSLAQMYGRWCVDRMIDDAVAAFGNNERPS